MKRTLIALIAALMLVSATACAESRGGEIEPVSEEGQTYGESPDKEPASAEGRLQSGVVRLDFSNGLPHGDFREETFQSYSESITDEELINELSNLTGLDFNVALSKEDDGRVIVDWAVDSTLIAGLEGREQKEEFIFSDEDSMRWFMMDSLWRTLGGGDNVYYTLDGGKELVFDKLFPVDFIPIDTPYKGSAFYYDQVGAISDFSYKDEEYNLVLRYPSSFAPEPEDTEAPIMRFPSRKDNSVLLYWVMPNTYGETPEAFAENVSAEETGVFENTVMGRGNDLDQSTGEKTPAAYFWLVDDDWIACAAVSCETEEQASYWYSKIVVESAIQIDKNESGISEQEAMDILVGAIDMAEGTAVVSYGEEFVKGVQCYIFAYGTNTPEKFTPEVHYAVTNEGKVLIFDIASNEYREL